jgi:hypothetical protein
MRDRMLEGTLRTQQISLGYTGICYGLVARIKPQTDLIVTITFCKPRMTVHNNAGLL